MKVRLVAAFLMGALVAFVSLGVVHIADARSDSEIRACANKKSGVLRLLRKGSCNKAEREVAWNSVGLAGPQGARGEKGEQGPKGDIGAIGPSGNGFAISELSICGPDGLSLCKIGVQGPGGGTIFFVDYQDVYPNFNYLEVAPAGWGVGVAVNQGGVTGETVGTDTLDPKLKWCDDTSTLVGLTSWSNSAVGIGEANTSQADAVCQSGAVQAAVDYVSTVGAKTDWFLPSIGEAMLMYENMRQLGLGNFSQFFYWTSSEFNSEMVSVQSFSSMGQGTGSRSLAASYVRPIRSF